MLHSAIRAFAESKVLLAQQLLHMYAFITFDGKQNSKLPHFAPMSKSTQCVRKLKMETISFMNYVTDSTLYYCFLIHWAYGANMAVILLADYIGNMMLSYQHLNVEHPKEFWIQIDNCAREGKNSVVFAFLHYIVYYEWFNTIYVLALFQKYIS
jgi:hypothetical protein